MLLDSPLCNFGWQAPEFMLPDLTGKRVSTAQSAGARGLLTAFICNHCPYVKAIIGRLVADSAQLAEAGVATIAVMPNDYAAYPEDAPHKMRAFARQHGFGFPYLLDETQAMARAYGAVCTPDFFGFNAEGELQYRGRLDDAKMQNPAGRKAELLEAMMQVAKTGRGPAQQFPSQGLSLIHI